MMPSVMRPVGMPRMMSISSFGSIDPRMCSINSGNVIAGGTPSHSTPLTLFGKLKTAINSLQKKSAQQELRMSALTQELSTLVREKESLEDQLRAIQSLAHNASEAFKKSSDYFARALIPIRALVAFNGKSDINDIMSHVQGLQSMNPQIASLLESNDIRELLLQAQIGDVGKKMTRGLQLHYQ